MWVTVPSHRGKNDTLLVVALRAKEMFDAEYDGNSSPSLTDPDG